MATAGNKGDLAAKWAMHRTIPTSRKAVVVNTTGSIDLSAVTADDGPDTTNARDLRGFWIYLTAYGADITIQRGNAPATAGKGLTLAVGAKAEEFFVDPGGSGAEVTLHGISLGAAELEIAWDDHQVAP